MKALFSAVCGAALCAGAMGFATAAHAAGHAAPIENPLAKESASLSLGGLDLATVEGQQRLAIRLDQAAAQVCGEKLASVHLALEEQGRACRAQVLADIRGQIERRMAQGVALHKIKLALID